ncbi:flavin reductase family protein [Singulisphaera rosea]
MDTTGASQLFRHLDRELWLVTSASGGRRGGLIATFVSQASLPPRLPRVVIGIAKQHHTGRLIERSGAFALHLIAPERIDWVWRFGLQSGRDVTDKFAGLSPKSGATGSPLFEEAPGWLDCRVESTTDTGDRTIFLAEVVDSRFEPRPFLTTKEMIARAPEDRRDELRRQIDRDVEVDTRAIEIWRSGRGPKQGR